MKQSGNALFLILIAVALFAALSYAVTQSGRGGGSIDREQRQLNVSVFLNYIAEIERGVQRLSLLGSGASNIEFYTAPIDTTIFNVPCSSGPDCIFASEGGGVNWGGRVSDFNIPVTDVPPYDTDQFLFTTNGSVQGVGTSAPEIMLLIFDVDTEYCADINRGLGLADPASLPNNVGNIDPDAVSYTINSTPGILSGCARETAAWESSQGRMITVFYSVLKAL